MFYKIFLNKIMENVNENNYIFLDDNDIGFNENYKREDIINEDSENFEFYNKEYSTNLSNLSIIVDKVKSSTERNLFLRYLFFIIYCNPFVKFLLNAVYYHCFNTKKNFDFQKILSKKERKIVSFITISCLICIDFVLFFTNLCDEYYLKLCLLFVNNLYLMYFVMGFYAKEKLRLEEKKSSWEGLINRLDNI